MNELITAARYYNPLMLNSIISIEYMCMSSTLIVNQKSSKI